MQIVTYRSLIPVSKEAVILEGSISGTGVLMCAVSIILAVHLKLHKQLIYRLAIYQVSSALAYGVTCIIDIVQLPILSHTGVICLPLCLANAFLSTYTLLVKLLFTFIITVHLFVFAVCYKNLKMLEGCYVASSLIIPAILAMVPFMTHTYGQQDYKSPWCWIQEAYNCTQNKAGIIEMFALQFGPALVICSAVLILIGSMFTVLMYRSFSQSRASIKHRVAIKQMIPLLSYPFIFSALITASTGSYVYYSRDTTYDTILITMDQVAYGSFVLSAGLTFLIHIGVMLKLKPPPTAKYTNI